MIQDNRYNKIRPRKVPGKMKDRAVTSTVVNRQLPGGLYKVVRSGLVHEYFMKVHSTVNIGSAKPSGCGIVYDTSKQPPRLEFIVDQYFSDYKGAFKKYYDDLLGTYSKAADITLESKFDSAISVMMDPFDQSSLPSSGLTRASGSSSTATVSGKVSGKTNP